MQFELDSIFVLSLAHGGLCDVFAIARCTNLTQLDLSHNALASVRGVESLTALRRLNLAHNALERLDGLAPLVALTHVRLEGNRLATPEAVQPLAALPRLVSVSLRAPDGGPERSGNPCCDLPSYPASVRALLPGVTTWDGQRRRHEAPIAAASSIVVGAVGFHATAASIATALVARATLMAEQTIEAGQLQAAALAAVAPAHAPPLSSARGMHDLRVPGGLARACSLPCLRLVWWFVGSIALSMMWYVG